MTDNDNDDMVNMVNMVNVMNQYHDDHDSDSDDDNDCDEFDEDVVAEMSDEWLVAVSEERRKEQKHNVHINNHTRASSSKNHNVLHSK